MQRNHSNRTVKILVYGALLAAIAVVLGRITAFYPAPGAKYTLDKFVMFMSGMFLGPAMGSMVGFVSDLVGGLLFGQGWTPWLCIPAVLYGLFGGIFRKMLTKKHFFPRLMLAYLFPIVIGSILIQSPLLAATYNPGTFWEDTLLKLASRTIQFTIMWAIEVPLIFILIKTGIFTRLGLWNPGKDEA